MITVNVLSKEVLLMNLRWFLFITVGHTVPPPLLLYTAVVSADTGKPKDKWNSCVRSSLIFHLFFCQQRSPKRTWGQLILLVRMSTEEEFPFCYLYSQIHRCKISIFPLVFPIVNAAVKLYRTTKQGAITSTVSPSDLYTISCAFVWQ